MMGMLAMPGVRVHGPPTMDGRTTTIAFTVDGRRPDDVAEFMQELKRSSYFKNIVLKKVETHETQGPIAQIVQFQITCNVSYSA